MASVLVWSARFSKYKRLGWHIYMRTAEQSYWAHSDSRGLPVDHADAHWQPLAEHLMNVAKLASRLARVTQPFSAAFWQMAAVAGILHDYGKYQKCFQNMLHSNVSGCPHAIYGAFAARSLPESVQTREWALPVVAVIAAHHAGLSDYSELKTNTSPKNPAVAAELERASGVWKHAVHDQPGIAGALKEWKAPGPLPGKDLFIRMLLSCLVDADRLDTAGLQPRALPLQPEIKLKQLHTHLEISRAKAVAKGASAKVLALRDEVQELCAAAAKSDARLLSLTVPTGGGKTLAAMRFALERARHKPDGAQHVIVVIPFLSIIEQNAKVYRDAFGNDALLEHHSGAVYTSHQKRTKQEGFEEALTPQKESGKQQGSHQRPLETENWDAPLIVTTSVRFFESLFSNHPSDLRRVHNIARSVIILDEVQTLPRRLLMPLLGMLKELTEDWGCTIVFSTATQPAFEARNDRQDYLWPQGTVLPIIPPDTAMRMHSDLQRVKIEWRLAAPMSWDALAGELAEKPQVLCVLNTRDHVAAVFDQLRAKLPKQHNSIFHLSTRMCPQHRLDVLEVIRERLSKGLPCRIVSSQLIEAGVDLSVPVAYRALGPFDAIVQVAGRVDREGNLTEASGEPAGRLIVFLPEDNRMPPHEYETAAAITRNMGLQKKPQTNDLEAMREYFESYYGQADGPERGVELAKMRTDPCLKFATLAEEFEYINSRTEDVFVPYGEAAELLGKLRATPPSARYVGFELLRKLQRYTVGLQPWEMERMLPLLDRIELPNGNALRCCVEAQYEEKGRGLLPDILADRFIVSSSSS